MWRTHSSVPHNNGDENILKLARIAPCVSLGLLSGALSQCTKKPQADAWGWFHLPSTTHAAAKSTLTAWYSAPKVARRCTLKRAPQRDAPVPFPDVVISLKF